MEDNTMPKNRKNWVDYKEIKAKVTMEMVLGHYGLLADLKESGQNLVGCCPIHKGSNPRQFSVNIERNIFNCFGNCKSGGNVLDFVSKMENVSIREAGLLIQQWCLSDQPIAEEKKEPPKEKRVRKKKEKNPKKKEEAPEPTTDPNSEKQEEEPINPPLTFQLKSLEPEHPFFEERGIVPATVQHFGLGFCSKGIMKGRIAIPIHNEQNQLVAYCGRAVTQEQIEEEGKYKQPPNFVKLAVAYNLNRQEKGLRALILVESFLSVFNLYQSGFPNTVALMGSVLGERQEELITQFLGPGGQAILLFDADEDGQICAEDCLGRLGRKIFVKVLDVGTYAKKPHQLAAEQAKDLLG